MATKKIDVIEDDVIEEEVKPSKKSNKDLDKLVEGRGFSSYNDAVEFAKTETFGKLHPFDQKEFNEWLENLK